ncbi:MAG: hypothetical protein ACXW38_12755, partial [Nitrospira sp.]
GSSRFEPDWEGHLDAIEAATGIGRATTEKCSKAIGAELAPKRINREAAQQNIRKRFSSREADFARPASGTVQIGHRNSPQDL